MTSLCLDHQFGPTLTYLSITRGPDNTAGIITLRLGGSPTTGKGASPLIADGLRGVSARSSARGRGQGLQVAEVMGDVCVLQAEMHTPKFGTEGLQLGLESGDLLFDGEEMSISTVVPLHICVNSPVISEEGLLNDKGVRVGSDCQGFE